MPSLYDIYKKIHPERVHVTKKTWDILGSTKALEGLVGQPKKRTIVADVRRKQPPPPGGKGAKESRKIFER